MLLIETKVVRGRILESDRAKLPDGVLCRVKYPVCNIDEVNANDRIYEREVWDIVLKDSVIQEKLNTRTLFGQAEHPAETQSDLQLTSHVITKMWIDESDNKLYQEMEIFDVPTGRIVDTLLRAGCQVGVSTRAEGDLEEVNDEKSGKKYSRVIPEAYRYTTTDFTADPSTFGVTPQKIERNVVTSLKKQLANENLNEKEKHFAELILESIACKTSKCVVENAKKLAKKVDEQKYEMKVGQKFLYAGAHHKIESIGGTTVTTIRTDLDDEQMHSWDRGALEKMFASPEGTGLGEKRTTLEDIMKQELIKVGVLVEYKGKECKVEKIEEDRISITTKGEMVEIEGMAYVIVEPDGKIFIQPQPSQPDVPAPEVPPPDMGVEKNTDLARSVEEPTAKEISIDFQDETKPELKPGMPVETKDGVKGKILSVNEDVIDIEADDGTQISFAANQLTITLPSAKEEVEEPIEEPIEEPEPEEKDFEDFTEEEMEGEIPESKLKEQEKPEYPLGRGFHPQSTSGRTKDQGAKKLFGKRLEDLTSEEREDVNRWVKESKTFEAKMGVDYVKTMKTAVKAAVAALKDKDYEAAAKALEDVADDASDASRAAKKMKRANDAKADAEKEKVEEEKSDQRYEVKCNSCGNVWVEEGPAEEVLCPKCGETDQDKFDVKAIRETEESKVDEEDLDETEDIKQMYRSAGLTPPKGKGIHTKAFHSCVIDVTKKGGVESPHAVCMASMGKEKAVHKAHQKESNESIEESWNKLWEDKIGEKTVVYGQLTVSELQDIWLRKVSPIPGFGKKPPKDRDILINHIQGVESKKESKVSTIAKDVKDLRIKEALTRAEKEKAFEILESLSDIEDKFKVLAMSKKLEAKILIKKLKESQLIESDEVKALCKMLEDKARAASLLGGQLSGLKVSLEKDLNDLKESADKVEADYRIKVVQLQNENKNIKVEYEKKLVEENKKAERILTRSVEKARKEVLNSMIKEFVDLKISDSGLKLHENVRALLEDCGSLIEVNETLEKVRDVKRWSALHSESLNEIAVMKPVDSKQDKVNKQVGAVFNSFGYKDNVNK